MQNCLHRDRLQPTFVIPTVIGIPEFKGRGGPLNDLDFCIGDEAIGKAASSSLTYPIRQGMVITHPALLIYDAAHCIELGLRKRSLDSGNQGSAAI